MSLCGESNVPLEARPENSSSRRLEICKNANTNADFKTSDPVSRPFPASFASRSQVGPKIYFHCYQTLSQNILRTGHAANPKCCWKSAGLSSKPGLGAGHSILSEGSYRETPPIFRSSWNSLAFYFNNGRRLPADGEEARDINHRYRCSTAVEIEYSRVQSRQDQFAWP